MRTEVVNDRNTGSRNRLGVTRVDTLPLLMEEYSNDIFILRTFDKLSVG